MGSQESPVLKITRLLEPNLDANCLELVDITDLVETIDKVPPDFGKSSGHFPILRIPSYSNDVLLGEALQIAFVLGNTTGTKFFKVFLRVEMVMEHEDTVETSTIFDGIDLEPNCKTLEAHYSYLFKTVSRYRMTCSVEYTGNKGPLILKKMFMWNCINPVQLSHTLVRLPDGRNHLETRVKNKSKTLLVLRAMKLENRADSRTYAPITQPSKDNICLLRPDESFSLVFLDVQVNHRRPKAAPQEPEPKSQGPAPEEATGDFDDFYLNVDWHSYTNMSGVNVSKVDVFSKSSELYYKVVNFPKRTKVNVPFNVDILLQNLTADPLEVAIKFNNSTTFIVQFEVDPFTLEESHTVSLPVIALSTGLHELDAIELLYGERSQRVRNLQVLVTN